MTKISEHVRAIQRLIVEKGYPPAEYVVAPMEEWLALRAEVMKQSGRLIRAEGDVANFMLCGVPCVPPVAGPVNWTKHGHILIELP